MGGATDTMVARWLGHADTSMVHQTYGHLLAYHGDINRMRFTDIPPSGLPVKPE
jgi:integrase